MFYYFVPSIEILVPGPRPLRLGRPARLHVDRRAEHGLRHQAAGAGSGEVGGRPRSADEAARHRAGRSGLASVPGVRQPRRGHLQGRRLQVRPAGELPAELQPVVADRHQRRGPDEGGGRHHGDVHVRPAAAILRHPPGQPAELPPRVARRRFRSHRHRHRRPVLRPGPVVPRLRDGGGRRAHVGLRERVLPGLQSCPQRRAGPVARHRLLPAGVALHLSTDGRAEPDAEDLRGRLLLLAGSSG